MISLIGIVSAIYPGESITYLPSDFGMNSFTNVNITDNISTIIRSQVIRKIEEYIYTINPDNVVYIAFDGVAPLAKLEQQRQKNDAIELQRFITKWGRFMHPCSYGEIESYVKQHPELMDKIKVVNPPIDTSLFEIL